MTNTKHVDYITHMGNDDTIVNAARVSFDSDASKYLPEQNEKLIMYLRKHKHWSPFSHCIVQFRITAPIYVARQLFKHQVGLAVNEVSRRYVNYPPKFQTPTVWRTKHPNKKQGSGEPSKQQLVVTDLVQQHLEKAKLLYDKLINIYNIAPEQARSILPLSLETSWIWTGSLEAWFRICSLRIAEDAQQETNQIAQEIATHIKELYPVAWSAYEQYP